MVDTKPLEKEALNFILSTVERYGQKSAMVNFDKNGGDFYVFKPIGNNKCVYLRCQSKGRRVSSRGSTVVIPKTYVGDDFLIFVYVKPDDFDKVAVFLYTAEDIRGTWKDRGESYKLSLCKTFIERRKNNEFLFNSERAGIIGPILEEYGKESKPEFIVAVSDSSFYFKMWQKTGGLPPLEYLLIVYDRDDIYDYMDTSKFVFLLCAIIIQNRDNDTTLSIDWAFSALKGFSQNGYRTNNYCLGKTYTSDSGITYYNTFVDELSSKTGELMGYHLHMADDEESLDMYVWRDKESLYY